MNTDIKNSRGSITPQRRGSSRVDVNVRQSYVYAKAAKPVEKPASTTMQTKAPLKLVLPVSAPLPAPVIHKNTPQRSEVLLHRQKIIRSADGKAVSPTKIAVVENTLHLEKPLAATANKAMLLSRVASANVIKQKKSKKRTRKPLFRKIVTKQAAIGLVVAIILSTTGYVSFTTWQTDNLAKQAFAAQVPATKTGTNTKVKTTNSVLISTPTKTDAAGTDNTPITKSQLSTYKVAANLPRAIYINNINVAARLMPMGVNNDNTLQVPTNINDAGWYSSSGQPGQPGAMLIDGHASETGTHYGLFGYVDTLKVGDKITVQRGDGVNFTYTIVHTEIDPLSNFDMGKLLVPYGGASQGLNIITCTGKWIENNTTLDHRLLVFATLDS
jgi:sortase (surface protein transpeptidase)